MLDKQPIAELINAYLAEQEQQYELITLQISGTNDIVVEVDSFDTMDVDFCAALSHHLQAYLDTVSDDYSLEVG